MVELQREAQKKRIEVEAEAHIRKQKELQVLIEMARQQQAASKAQANQYGGLLGSQTLTASTAGAQPYPGPQVPIGGRHSTPSRPVARLVSVAESLGITPPENVEMEWADLLSNVLEKIIEKTCIGIPKSEEIDMIDAVMNEKEKGQHNG